MSGAKWLSLVLWGTPILTQKLLMEKLETFAYQDGMMDEIHRWFFVRYWDILPQLRFRILVSSGQAERTKNGLEEKLEPYLLAHQLWKLEWVSFRLEPERYGKVNIPIIEGLFQLQSQWVVQLFKEESNEEKRLQELLQIYPVLLNTVFSDPMEIQTFIREQHKFFGNRLDGAKADPRSISKAYRNMASSIDLDKDPKREYTGLVHGMVNAMGQLKFHGSNKFQLIRDTLHMMVNKCFLTDHSQWEFLLYEFLNRVYRSYLARRNP
jgi:thiopeptide-type bacteriocin biosynthesis protein